MRHTVKILQKDWITHNVIRLRLEKPNNFSFNAGQAIEVTIDTPAFLGDMAPFTLTGLNTDTFLELILKVYPKHKGITQGISNLEVNDTLIITDPWDSYKNMGPGTFIAGGTGITPFLAIIRDLNKRGSLNDSRLYFCNKATKDIFLYDELHCMLGERFVNILSREKKNGYLHGRLDEELVRKIQINPRLPIYICGPGNFAETIRNVMVRKGIHIEQINISY